MKASPDRPQSVPEESLPGSGFQPAGRLMISTAEHLKIISDPLRLRMLELIGKEALTVKQMAGRLKEPATKLYYHIAELESAGFVVMVDTRVKSGIIEKYYRASAESLSVDRKLLSISAENPLPDLLSLVFETTVQEISNSVASGLIDLEPETPGHNLVLTRTTFNLRRADVPLLATKLRELVAEMDAAEPLAGEDTVSYACLVAFYPRTDAFDGD